MIPNILCHSFIYNFPYNFIFFYNASFSVIFSINTTLTLNTFSHYSHCWVLVNLLIKAKTWRTLPSLLCCYIHNSYHQYFFNFYILKYHRFFKEKFDKKKNSTWYLKTNSTKICVLIKSLLTSLNINFPHLKEKTESSYCFLVLRFYVRHWSYTTFTIIEGKKWRKIS